MTNKKKGKQKSGGGRQTSEKAAPNRCAAPQSAEQAAAAEALPPDGRYARYKRSTELVQGWCDALLGRSSCTLRDWEYAMDELAARGEKMPADVLNQLGVAISLREEANDLYRAIQAAEDDQRRHWHVVRLLRRFRRLFSPRKQAAAPSVLAGEPVSEAPSSSSLGFEKLEVEATATSDDDDSGSDAAFMLSADGDSGGAPIKEDDVLFAFACLMTDAARTRDEVCLTLTLALALALTPTLAPTLTLTLPLTLTRWTRRLCSAL